MINRWWNICPTATSKQPSTMIAMNILICRKSSISTLQAPKYQPLHTFKVPLVSWKFFLCPAPILRYSSQLFPNHHSNLPAEGSGMLPRIWTSSWWHRETGTPGRNGTSKAMRIRTWNAPILSTGFCSNNGQVTIERNTKKSLGRICTLYIFKNEM